MENATNFNYELMIDLLSNMLETRILTKEGINNG